MNELKKSFWPRGLVLNLHKYYNPPVDYLDKTIDFFQSSPVDHQKTFTAFGNFDRLAFCPVLEFSDYRAQASKAYTWLGNRQSILLYPLHNEKNRCFGFQEDRFGLVDKAGKFSEIQSNYLLITLLYTAGGTKTSVQPYEAFLDYCANAIYNIANTYNELNESNKLSCEVFGTFNSAELAVVWTGNEFADILYLIDNLRYLTLNFSQGDSLRAFISSHTFVALARSKCPEEHQGMIGGALIQMAGRTIAGIDYKDKSGYEIVADYVREAVERAKKDSSEVPSTMYCAGEYDLILQVDPSLLPGLFQDSENTDNFYIHNPAFCSHILESTTRLYYKREDVQDLHLKMQMKWREPNGKGLLDVQIPQRNHCNLSSREYMDIVSKICEQTDDEIKEKFPNVRTLFMKLREKVANLLPESSGFLSTIDLAYSDYIQCSTTAVDHLWVRDFDAQFRAVLTILINCRIALDGDDGAFSPSDYLEQVQDMFRALQQQCYHVVDAGKLFFEEPRSHFSYTGQYDLLMHAYYGILKCLLEMLYTPPRAQSTLYPLINFESAPALRSQLCYESIQDTPAESPNRLLVIRLPYDAWTSLDHYIPMLIHEVYHYAAPMNRNQRNYYFGCILMTWLHTHILEQGLNNAISTAGKEHQALQIAACLITVRAQEIFAAFFAEQLKPAKDSTKNDCFKTQYIDKLVCFLNSISNHYNTTLGALATTLRDGIEEYVEQKEWTQAFEKCEASEISDVQEVLQQFFEGLSRVERNEKGIEQYKKLVDWAMRNQWAPILETLNEIFPDVAMVKLSGLNTESYLLQFSIHQNNQLMKPHELSTQTLFRLGCILDWTTGCLEKAGTGSGMSSKDCITELEKRRDSFYHLYNQVCLGSEVSGQEWFDYYVKAYSTYLDHFSFYYPWLKKLVFEEYLPCIGNTVPGSAAHHLTEFCMEYYTILSKFNSGQVKEKLFEHTIHLVQAFQLQKDLGEIDEAKQEQTPQAITYPVAPVRLSHLTKVQDDSNWHFYLESPSHLHFQLTAMVQRLRHIHQAIFKNAKYYKPWFRGCKNATYDILPSIMVHYMDDVNGQNFTGKNSMGTLLEYQWRLLEEYKFRADGAPELLNSSKYNRLDYLALMQHYGQHTGLLDWSEDAYSSLYFALEKFVDNPGTKIEGEEDAPATLYIMDPRLYNRARKQIIEELKKEGNLPVRYFNTIDCPEGYIPNLSIPENIERYSMFIPGNRPDPHGNTLYYKTGCAPLSVGLEKVNGELCNLPLAIYTPRLNPRLRAQSGIFLSYNLCSLPVEPAPGSTGPIPPGHLFHYLSLESIQRYYLSHFDEEPFLLKLIINKKLKPELGKTLYCLGVNRYRVYPELEQLNKKP